MICFLGVVAYVVCALYTVGACFTFLRGLLSFTCFQLLGGCESPDPVVRLHTSPFLYFRQTIQSVLQCQSLASRTDGDFIGFPPAVVFQLCTRDDFPTA